MRALRGAKVCRGVPSGEAGEAGGPSPLLPAPDGPRGGARGEGGKRGKAGAQQHCPWLWRQQSLWCAR